MRPTTALSASTTQSSSFHWPEGREAEARFRISSESRRIISSTLCVRPPVAVRDTIYVSSGLAGLLRDGHYHRECPMKALAISLVAGAALCSLMSVPASAMPMSNLAAAASDLALGQSVRYVRHPYRYRLSRSSYYAYRAGYYGSGGGYPGYARDCYGRGFGPGSPCYP